MTENRPLASTTSKLSDSRPTIPSAKKCYLCHKPGHLARDCRSRPAAEGGGRGNPKKSPSVIQKVTVDGCPAEQGSFESTQDGLYSSDEDTTDPGESMVRVADKGSQPQCVRIQIQGVPAYGLIDSGADITIMGGTLFWKVATVACLKKRDLKSPDKTPRNYDQAPFTLDGHMDLDVSFGDKTMCTPIYIKADAHEQLLLSEGVCRQLGILQYHTNVEPWRGGKKRNQSTTSATVPSHPEKSTCDGSKRTSHTDAQDQSVEQTAGVPTVRVRLAQSLRLLPHQGASVSVEFEPDHQPKGTEGLLLKSSTC